MLYEIEEGLEVVSGPAVQAVTTQEAKDWARVTTTADDTLIGALVVAATRRIQNLADGTAVQCTYRLTLDAFPLASWQPGHLPGRMPQVQGGYATARWLAGDTIRIRRPPLVSVTSIIYVATDGSTITLDPSKYQVDGTAKTGRIVPAYGTVWPATRNQMGAVKILYTAGYADAASVPETVKTAIKIVAAWLYRFRGDDDSSANIPQAAIDLLGDFGSGRYR